MKSTAAARLAEFLGLPASVSDAMTTGAPLTILEPETWEGKPVPETRWIIRGPIPALAVCSLGGHGDTGKSILGLQAGVARALDRDWLGFPASYGKTLIVSCEDPKEQIHIRLASILRHYGATFADLGDRLRIIDRNDMVNSMMDWRTRWEPGEVTPFYCQTLNHALQMYADLVVIDSRYDVFVGEQNDTPQVTEFMGAMRTLAIEISGAVLLLAHPSRAGLDSGDGESGSVAWHNKVRSRMYLRQASPERDGDCDRVLEHLKSNWGQKFEPVHLRWSDGAFVADRPATGVIATIERGQVERDFISALEILAAQGTYVSDAKNSPRYAPRVMIERLKLRYREGNIAVSRRLEELGLRESVPGQDGTTRSTKLGNELYLDLVMVFVGLWAIWEIPGVLQDHGLIDEAEAEQIFDKLAKVNPDDWELADPEASAILRPFVQRAYRELYNPSALLV